MLKYTTVFFANYQEWNSLRIQTSKYDTTIQVLKKGEVVDRFFICNLIIDKAYLINMRTNKANEQDIFKVRVVTNKKNEYDIVIKLFDDMVEKVYYRRVEYGKEE